VILDLCRMFDIPLQTPKTDKVIDWSSFKGVLGHHHISSHKWDCAPWWGVITDGILEAV